MRGVFVSPGYRDGMMVIPGSRDAFIRHALAYFDRISMPVGPLGSREAHDEVEALRALGVHEEIVPEREVFQFPADNAADRQIVRDFWLARTAAGETWNVNKIFRGPPTSALSELFDEEESPTRLINFELTGALPSPPEETSYESILEFRQTRRDDLEALHHALHRLAIQFSGARDITEAVQFAVGEVKESLSSIDRLMEESWPRRLLKNLGLDFLDPLWAGGIAYQLEKEPTIEKVLFGGALAGGGAAVLKAVVRTIQAPKLPEGLRSFGYAVDVRGVK